MNKHPQLELLRMHLVDIIDVENSLIALIVINKAKSAAALPSAFDQLDGADDHMMHAFIEV